MAKIHNLGFPRIGAQRELKKALESYWKNDISQSKLESTAKELRSNHWKLQSQLDWLPVGDFSFYDQVLDTSFLVGNIPERARKDNEQSLENYFRVARGRAHQSDNNEIFAGEMTKWFDTNYHYIVPEFCNTTEFSLNADRLIAQIQEAKSLNHNIKPVVLGPLSYLKLGKSSDGTKVLTLLDKLIPVYQQLLTKLADEQIEWLQLDEPILVTDLDSHWQQAFEKTYHQLQTTPVKLLVASYFGELQNNLQLLCNLPVSGIHVDAVRGKNEIAKTIDWLPSHKVLSLGVIDGRNIWKSDLNKLIEWLSPIATKLEERLWLAPSCSLLHVPVDLELENQLNPEIKNWLAFAVQKLDELKVLEQAINQGKESVANKLSLNEKAIESRKNSPLVNDTSVKSRIADINEQLGQRQSTYLERAKIQKQILNLPEFPTTTIGSFPQTPDIRKTRRDFKQGTISFEHYQKKIQSEIHYCVQQQESLDLDVFVHGEAERNDMVEYFGEQLQGFAISSFGWVQSYGSRCVKPPILFGDVSRQNAMTVEWTQYAQSLTDKPMKGMLTGPVTILNWSFVRDDQPLDVTCKQISLAIRDEVLDLETSGTQIIQIDEAALREGLPLRKSQWQEYLDWAVESFRITANGVQDKTQIHTHMCYSEFNDIINAIADMDADVITIETSRSNMELLDVFDEFEYPNEIGPGVYDIHSPNRPAESSILRLMRQAQQRIPKERLWVNPDCGLKTRKWDEVIPALETMVSAAKSLRQAS